MTRTKTGRHFHLETLARGVHAAIATPTGYGLCNAGIVDLGGSTVVFDSMLTPMAGAELARAAERVTGQKPTWVVNSHWHGDHIWGNTSFVDGHVVSSRRVRQEVLQRSGRQFDDCRREFPKEIPRISAPGSRVAPRDRPQIRAWFRGVLEIPRPFRIVPPEVTFDEELVLTGSRRSLRLISYGGGHSPSDVFAFLPDEKILFSGDLTMVGLHPSVSDGWPDRWSRILRRMDRLGADRVLPGHGPIGSGKAIPTERVYLQELERTVTRAVETGATLAEARKLPIPQRYAKWGFSLMYADNVARAYRLTKAAKAVRARRR